MPTPMEGRLEGNARFVGVHEQRSPRVTYTFKLTPKGQKMAEKLRETTEIIGE